MEIERIIIKPNRGNKKQIHFSDDKKISLTAKKLLISLLVDDFGLIYIDPAERKKKLLDIIELEQLGYLKQEPIKYKGEILDIKYIISTVR